jgi:hypothetical protein
VCCEVKGAENNIMQPIFQAAIEGTNFAMQLLALGVAPQDCTVPVIGITGLTIVFGVIRILAPSFPIFVPISKLLDQSDPQEQRVAAAYLNRVTKCAKELGKRIATQLENGQQRQQIKSMTLCDRKIHIKRINAQVFERGLGLFAGREVNTLRLSPD